MNRVTESPMANIETTTTTRTMGMEGTTGDQEPKGPTMISIESKIEINPKFKI